MYKQLTVNSSQIEPISIHLSAASTMFWVNFLREYRPTVKIEHSDLSALPSFATEIFHRIYYDFEPSFKEAIAPEHQWAKSLHEVMSRTEDLKGLAFQCSGNPVAAGLATAEVVEVLLQQLPVPKQPIEDLDTLRRQARKAAREGNQVLLQQLQEKGKSAAQAAVEYANALAEKSLELSEIISEGASSATEKVETAKKNLEMLGMGWSNEPGNPTQVNFNERLALAKQLENQPLIQKVLNMAGNLLDTALRQRRKQPVAAGYGELVGITVGADLGRLLPSELSKLSSPSQRLLFYKGFSERSLLQYELEAPDDKGKGPIVMCLDSSGSMEGAPEIWAKGLCIALTRLAAKENRDIVIIPFSNVLGSITVINAGELNCNKLLQNVIRLTMNGGTSFEKPLKAALDLISKSSSLKQADIVFLTDGEANISDRFIELFQKRQEIQKIALFTLLVSERTPNSTLKEISDSIWNIKDLTGGKDLESLFAVL